VGSGTGFLLDACSDGCPAHANAADMQQAIAITLRRRIDGIEFSCNKQLQNKRPLRNWVKFMEWGM
jgi:hypothetical protein